MKEPKTNGYIAGTIFLLVGILVLSIGLEQDWSSGKYPAIIGGFLSLLGVGSLWKPETIGHVVATWMKNAAESNKSQMNHNYNRTNIRAKHNNYTGNASKVYNITNYNYLKKNFKKRRY